jgi:DNA-binding NtrC family response regulator
MTSSQPLCLIIDADAAHARALASLCEKQGFEVRHEEPRPELLDDRDLAASDIAFVDGALGLEAMSRLADTTLADTELFAMAAEDDTAFAEDCIRAGYSFFFRKPFEESSLVNLLADIAAEASVSASGADQPADESSMVQFGMMRGSSRGMRKLFRTLRKLGPTDTAVLVVGESGTGKELVAETLHQQSARSAAPYLTLNCAAIAENLIESELFGHEKGAFSGAQKQHQGFFERAEGGTLFLDEITEMSADLQAKLLRALESGEVRRVGAVESRRVDVRIVAATNRDPREAIGAGHLREDLYYRLAHVTVKLPPLRRRGADIVGLARFFLRQLNERHDTALAFSDDALEAIQSYPWPGNVRQLRHTVERAYIMSDEVIDSEAFALESRGEELPEAADIPIRLGVSLAECERRIILANLEHLGGDKKATAEVLGVSLKTLYNRLRDYESDDHDDS